MDTTTYIFIGVAVVVVAIVAVYTILRNKKINENGIEVDAVISRIDTDTQTDSDGSVSENKTYYVEYQNAEGGIVTAKLGNPPFGAAVGTAMRVKYLPEKPKYVRRVK
ncbi:MAG TPA: hypothetical protein DEO95_00510 [Ruminococcaceae bacterium]|jgi:hypothetical protein|nr:hypothetical protein [Ruminococcus sp.]HCA53960.1 hypothetical protein [Oscillospiraceae bacterium]